MKLRTLPIRVATGAFILHSGLEKWGGGREQAEGVHGMAAGAYPFLGGLDAATFLKSLSASELALGAALLAPVVPAAVAGVGLAAFAGGLLGLYLRTPALHKPGSVWPTQAGIAVSKDVWLLGGGLGLIVDGLTSDD